MHPLIENFKERPLSHKILAWIISILFLCFMFWQYFYKDLVQEREELDEKITSLRVSINEKRKIARNLDKFRKEVADLEVKLKAVLMELPDARQIHDLLSNIETLARESGLVVNLFKPGGDVIRDFYAEVPVSVSVEGTYHQVASFFDEVGRLPRIVNVKQISVREPKRSDDGVIIKTDCTAVAYRALEEHERNQAAQEGDAKKRRRKR
jgi:type IV pilus assembly protein PilO